MYRVIIQNRVIYNYNKTIGIEFHRLSHKCRRWFMVLTHSDGISVFKGIYVV